MPPTTAPRRAPGRAGSADARRLRQPQRGELRQHPVRHARREISCTIVCQTVSQLEARYGKPAANSIIGNCDHQLVLGFQDEATARYFSLRANKPAASLLATRTDRWWLFQRGHAAVCDKAYQLEQHPRYADLAAWRQAEPGADLTEMWLDDIDQEFFDFEELGPEDLELFGDANAA